MHRLHVIAALAASAALATGCGSDPKPQPKMAASGTAAPAALPPDPAAAHPARPDVSTPTSGSIHIEDKILRACGNLPIAHFAFDSAAVQGDAATALDALARCFTTGPLAGRGMLLTGHTDSRGEVEYNLALGQRRSGSVAGYLASHGMEKKHLTTNSRGEFDATGTDEQGWARDRRVDVSLVE